MGQTATHQMPGTSWLILANGLIWCIYGGFVTIHGIMTGGFNPIALLIILVASGLAIGVTCAGQAVIHWFTKHRHVRPVMRTLLFAVPSLFLVIAVLALPGSPKSVRVAEDLASPSGVYFLSMPIEKNAVDPQYRSTGVWKVTITNADGEVEYKDENSTFIGFLKVYWMWDRQDRVWLYNSDTSDVYYWEKRDGAWTKHHWGHGRTKLITAEIIPPDELYPEYVHKPQG